MLPVARSSARPLVVLGALPWAAPVRRGEWGCTVYYAGDPDAGSRAAAADVGQGAREG